MNVLGLSITRTNKAPAPDYSGMTLQEQFQERYAKNAVNDLFKAFRYVNWMITVVTAVAMGINYTHQRDYFANHHAGTHAWFIPISVDCVMLALMKVSQMAAISPRNRWIARAILVLPAGGSMAINFMATDDDVLRWVYVGVTGAIVICEVAHGLMVPNLASMERKQAELAATAAPAAVVPSASATHKAQRKNTANARTMAANNPRLKPAELAAAANISRGTAKKILDEVAAQVQASIPTSPAPAGMHLVGSIRP